MMTTLGVNLNLMAASIYFVLFVMNFCKGVKQHNRFDILMSIPWAAFTIIYAKQWL